MKELDDINPHLAKPEKILSLGAIMSVLVGGTAWMFASEASGSTPFGQELLSLLCLIVIFLACIFAIAAKLFKWGWQTKYFGLGSFYIGSVSLLGIIPWLCIVLYSQMFLWVRAVLFLMYGFALIWWCRRFVIHYKMVMSDDKWRNQIYEEGDDAVYYLQKNDTRLMEKKFRFRQIPNTAFIIVALLLATLLFPFYGKVSTFVTLPFMHIFAAVSFFPFVLMTLGLATRGYLIYYYYPGKIEKITGKKVYVDMSTKYSR